MTVALVTEDPFGDDIESGLRAIGVDITPMPLVDTTPTEFAIVAGGTDTELFADANEHLEARWMAIELGGVAGFEVQEIPGMLVVFGENGPCYDCLRARLETTSHAPVAESPVDTSMARFAGAFAGYHLDKELAPGTILTVDGQRRELLPTPGCRCVGSFERTALELDFREQPLSSVIERVERALDPVFGPVIEVAEQASYPAPYYLAHIADTTPFSDVEAPRYGAGVDSDWNAAFMRAVGESLERYSAGSYRLESCRTTPSSRPIEFEQFAQVDETDEFTGRYWPGIDLISREPVDLPTELVVFPPPDPATVGGITTGLGLGSSTVEALTRGLLETIERDACMLAWYSSFTPMKLVVQSDTYRSLANRAISHGLTTTVLAVTQDIDIPVVTAVVHRRSADGEPVMTVPGIEPDDWPSFAVGSAADLNPTHAAERALAEAIQNWLELANMGEEAAKEEGAIGEFASFPRQARTLLDTSSTVTAEQIGPADIPAGMAKFETVCDRVDAVDLNVYAARVTTPDLERLGFEAVRVLIPEAQPLVRRGQPSSKRAKAVPKSLGFRPQLDKGIHPYP